MQKASDQSVTLASCKILPGLQLAWGARATGPLLPGAGSLAADNELLLRGRSHVDTQVCCISTNMKKYIFRSRPTMTSLLSGRI